MTLSYEQRLTRSRSMAKLWTEDLTYVEKVNHYKHGEIRKPSKFQMLHIRNLYGRNCVLCGKSEVFNDQQLSLHHIESERSHGDGKPWLLSLLCEDCHTKIHQPTLDSHNYTLLLLKAFELAYEEEPWIRRSNCHFTSADDVRFELEPLLI